MGGAAAPDPCGPPWALDTLLFWGSSAGVRPAVLGSRHTQSSHLHTPDRPRQGGTERSSKQPRSTAVSWQPARLRGTGGAGESRRHVPYLQQAEKAQSREGESSLEGQEAERFRLLLHDRHPGLKGSITTSQHQCRALLSSYKAKPSWPAVLQSLRLPKKSEEG